MKLIHHNLFRTADVLANAKITEILDNKNKFISNKNDKYDFLSEYSFSFLKNAPEVSLDRFKDVFIDIEKNQKKLLNGIFWFIDFTDRDKEAICYLKKSKDAKAIDIWTSLTNGQEVSFSNFSAFNNLSTYMLVSELKDNIKVGIELKFKLIDSIYFKKICHMLTDEKFVFDKKIQTIYIIDELLNELNNKYTTHDIMYLFSNCSDYIKQCISERLYLISSKKHDFFNINKSTKIMCVLRKITFKLKSII